MRASIPTSIAHEHILALLVLTVASTLLSNMQESRQNFPSAEIQEEWDRGQHKVTRKRSAKADAIVPLLKRRRLAKAKEPGPARFSLST